MLTKPRNRKPAAKLSAERLDEMLKFFKLHLAVTGPGKLTVEDDPKADEGHRGLWCAYVYGRHSRDKNYEIYIDADYRQGVLSICYQGEWVRQLTEGTEMEAAKIIKEALDEILGVDEKRIAHNW